MAKLEILDGDYRGRVFEFFDGRIVVGRGADSDLQVRETSMSRHHAELTQADDGWMLRDLNSSNGVFIDDRKITETLLKNRVRFRLGGVTFIFTDDVVHDDASATRKRGAPKTADTASRSAAASEQSAVAPSPLAETRMDVGPDAGESVAVDIDQVKDMARIYPRIQEQFGRTIVGQRDVLEEIMIAIAADAHCLMIGLPGLAKTMMVSTLSRILQLDFRRIQFTPDLMPSDILGTEVLDVAEDGGEKAFRFIKGPIFTNMLLADEINRTPPKTQAALLESMQEKQVTIANQTFALPRPFFVLATQNPLEQEGTYPLPEAQLDRFMLNITVDYPSAAEEEEIVARTTAQVTDEPRRVLGADELMALQKAVRLLPASPHVIKYATALVRATRPKEPSAPAFIREHIYCGAGPRAAQFLVLGAKARAVVHGRVNVSCEDVRKLALPVIRHRLFTNFTADSEGITPDDLIVRLLETIAEPEPES